MPSWFSSSSLPASPCWLLLSPRSSRLSLISEGDTIRDCAGDENGEANGDRDCRRNSDCTACFLPCSGVAMLCGCSWSGGTDLSLEASDCCCSCSCPAYSSPFVDWDVPSSSTCPMSMSSSSCCNCSTALVFILDRVVPTVIGQISGSPARSTSALWKLASGLSLFRLGPLELERIWAWKRRDISTARDSPLEGVFPGGSCSCCCTSWAL